jgi:hypothetical protein
MELDAQTNAGFYTIPDHYKDEAFGGQDGSTGIG